MTPPFSNLRRFPEGRKFRQWTGNDSKGLMKVSALFHSCRNILTDCMDQVYLPALVGYVPDDMVKTFGGLSPKVRLLVHILLHNHTDLSLE